ncbi:MAG: DUF6265 family protein [Proteobacteria bacterium]|nr:DUF6265 family protein [Pseudomonadota bacterium]
MRTLTALLLIPMLASIANSAQSSLDWLSGCWVTDDQSSQEVWVVNSDKSLLGFGVALDAGKIVFYEVLSITQNDNGLWTYTAHPSGQESASFIEVETSENRVVFAKPDHDYPQVISYRRHAGQLYAIISLLGGDNPNSFDKIACK